MSAVTYGGRYAVIERIGVGGMAEVYRARDELLGREVAVKVLNERLSTDRSFVERFRREAQAAANLSHPNIVSLYDYGTDESSNFIVMEFIDGSPLGDVIKNEGPLLPERAAEIAGDVAKALERAHTAGLVHRDVKPNNIMLTSTGQTKVTDFGIVRALGGEAEQQMTQTGVVIGTAAYLSPEQAQGNAVDARSDVYSLGCVLYEMLTGRAPFSGDTPLAVAYKHVRETAQPPSNVNADVPPALDAITMKALAKNPDNRFQNAAEMREDLDRFLSGQKVTATPLLADATAVIGAPGGSTQVMGRTGIYEDDEPEGRSAGWYVAIALLILGLFALVAYFVATNLLGSAELVDVPRVIGLEEEEAVDRLETAGFEVQVETGPHERDEGTVFKQEPKANERLAEGERVTIFVSEGPQQVEVPNVVGDPIEDAKRTIRQAGLKVGDVTEEASEEVDEDNVIRQSPEGGFLIETGEPVDLVVSSGPEAVIVPDVINQSEESAIDELERAGLEVVVQRAPSDVDEGLVVSQDPQPGTEVEPGDTVEILVSEGPEEQAMPNVIGMDGDDAETMLERDYGLNVTQEEVACSNAAPPGEVCDQDPEPGEPVSEGDSATLFVQTGDSSVGFGAGVAWAFSAWGLA